MSILVGETRFDQILRLMGGRKPKSARVRAIQRRAGVPRSSELRRITQLRRRRWTDDEIEEAVEVLTETLKTPNGTMRLWPLQAMAIAEIVDNRGALLPIPAGDGKALISILTPTLLDDCERPLIIVPAHLREQTKRDVLPKMRKHWRIRDDIRVIGYSELSLAKNAEMLDELRPEYMALDECHYLKHTKSGRTRRVRRFMREHPDVVVAAMSGTITQRSLHDYSHIVEWTHGKEKSPLPTRHPDLCDWAQALDEHVPDEKRLMPGALQDLCEGEESARDGFKRRLVETPGIVFGDSSKVTSSLVIRKLDWKAPLKAQDALKKLRQDWEDPNGDAVMEAIDLWRKARQLSLGFWLKWDPPAPRDWLDARKDWNTYVRDTLNHNQRGLDTPLQVYRERAAEHGMPRKPPKPQTDDVEAKAKHEAAVKAWRADVDAWEAKQDPEHCEWCRWRAIRDTFKPNTVAEWLDERMAERCADWAQKEKGIVWVENPAFGEKIAEIAGIPYFGASDERILDYDGSGIVASLRAHGTGRNLQDRWHKMLFTSPPSSAHAVEQALARCHRAGQPADEVEAYFVLGEEEQIASLHSARSQAEYVRQTIGTRQRLLYATYDFDVEEVS